MTGPEHYREAERLIERADALVEFAAEQHGQESAIAGFHMTMARAQVHATLALAAATAMSTIVDESYEDVQGVRDWAAVVTPAGEVPL